MIKASRQLANAALLTLNFAFLLAFGAWLLTLW